MSVEFVVLNPGSQLICINCQGTAEMFFRTGIVTMKTTGTAIQFFACFNDGRIIRKRAKSERWNS